MTRFGLIATALVTRLEAEAASLSPPPARASNPARHPPALAVRGETDGHQFKRKERAQ